MRLAEVARQSAFCRVAGKGPVTSGEVLLIHGLGESSSCFAGLLEAEFPAGWILVAPDLPGYGRSPFQESASLPDYARLLASWIESSLRFPLIVVGHSMGGVIGQFLCELIPELVQAFVNVEGNLSPEDCAFSGVAARDSRENFRQSGFESLLLNVQDAGQSDPACASYWQSMRVCQVDQFYNNSLELVAISGQEDLARRMSVLDLPVAYIAGLRDRPAASRSLALLEESKVNWLGFQNSGHWPFIDEPERFRQVLEDILRGLSKPIHAS